MVQEKTLRLGHVRFVRHCFCWVKQTTRTHWQCFLFASLNQAGLDDFDDGISAVNQNQGAIFIRTKSASHWEVLHPLPPAQPPNQPAPIVAAQTALDEGVLPQAANVPQLQPHVVEVQQPILQLHPVVAPQPQQQPQPQLQFYILSFSHMHQNDMQVPEHIRMTVKLYWPAGVQGTCTLGIRFNPWDIEAGLMHTAPAQLQPNQAIDLQGLANLTGWVGWDYGFVAGHTLQLTMVVRRSMTRVLQSAAGGRWGYAFQFVVILNGVRHPYDLVLRQQQLAGTSERHVFIPM
jgi:hypothetical protein